ncbi:MAG: hypothetical protein IPG59_21185 [Candidatus Melainabacteria bacterium]|nr:MAG: hypothetical protein IPG59_21185 [Candidatus Melainabacteria bacterium]
MKYLRWFMIGTICLALVAVTTMVYKNSAELKRLTTFTQWYTGYDVTVGPTFDVPRLPPAKNLEFAGHLGGTLSACALHENLAAFSTGPELHLYDISDLKNPKELSKILLLSKIEEITFEQAGNAIYVADGRGGLRIIDIADPKAPKEIATYGHRGAVQHVLQRGSLVYVASKLDGLQILKQERNKLSLLKFDDRTNHPNGPCEIGNMCSNQDFLVSSDTVNGLRLMLLRDPEFPVISGKHTMPHVEPDFVGCEGNTVVVASSKPDKEQEIKIFELTGCGAREASTLKVPDFKANGVKVKNKLAFIYGTTGIVTLNLADLGSPKIVEQNFWKSASPVLSLAIENDKGCATTQDGQFVVLDLKDKPAVAASLLFPNYIVSSHVDKRTGQLFIGAQSGIFASSLSNLSNCKKCVDLKSIRYVRIDEKGLAVKTDDNLEIWKLAPQTQKTISVSCPRLTSAPVFFQGDFLCGGENGVVSTGTNNLLKDESVDTIASDGRTLVTAPAGFFGMQTFRDKITLPKDAKFVHTAMHQGVLDLAIDHGFIYYIQGKFMGDNSLFVSSPSIKEGEQPKIALKGARKLCVNNGLIAVEENGFVGLLEYKGKDIKRIAELQSTAVPLSISDLQLCGNLVLISGQDNGLYVYLVKQ